MNEDGLTDAVQEAGAVELLLVRHGESEGNVAATEARLAGAEIIQVPARDPDVNLSGTGPGAGESTGNGTRPDRRRVPAGCCGVLPLCPRQTDSGYRRGDGRLARQGTHR